MSYNPDR